MITVPGMTAKSFSELAARRLAIKVTRQLWSGSPRKVFLIATGLYRNKIRLMGPDAKFKGLDQFIQTAKEGPGKYE